jgi:ribosomal protein S25
MKLMKKAQMKKDAKTWKKMTDEEICQARKWYKEEKLKPSEIAKRLGRDKSVMTRLLVKRVTRRGSLSKSWRTTTPQVLKVPRP